MWRDNKWWQGQIKVLFYQQKYVSLKNVTNKKTVTELPEEKKSITVTVSRYYRTEKARVRWICSVTGNGVRKYDFYTYEYSSSSDMVVGCG